MNKLICIAYQPGAYGSFLAWTIERFSFSRRGCQPPVMDDPLKPNGSSHAYASFCKVKDNSSFIEDMYTARNAECQWNYLIYAGWPQGIGEDIGRSISMVLKNLTVFEKVFMVECVTPEDHMLRYLRNENTMDQARWYGMMDAKTEDDLLKRLAADISAIPLPADFNAPYLHRINIEDLLSSDASMLFDRIAKHLGWMMCDRQLFVDTLHRMRQLQKPYYHRLEEIKAGVANTPVERIINGYLKGER